MTHVSLCAKTKRFTVRIMIPRDGQPRRELAITIGESLTPPGGLYLAVFGRVDAEMGKFQPYPGDDLPFDFLDRREHTVLLGGLVQLAESTLGREMDDATMKLVIDVVRDVLECVASHQLLDAAA